jgi:putative phosphoribosyl transferase
MSYTPLFANRTDAGEKLAQKIDALLSLQAFTCEAKPVAIVYALPRGGLPVAAPVARLLGCPLSVIVAKKISHPQNPELAIGAVTASGHVLWTGQNVFRRFKSWQWREEALNTAISKAKSLEAKFSPACPPVNAEGATVILVDDGIATGMTIAVAAMAVRDLSPKEVWLCTPLAPLKILPWLNQWCDRAIVLETPEPFLSVSNFYAEFPQVETREAISYLQH